MTVKLTHSGAGGGDTLVWVICTGPFAQVAGMVNVLEDENL